MTERARMGAVYRRETPDQVPFFLDLSHWFNHRFARPYDLSQSILEPDEPLIAYHRKVSAGFYMPNQTSYYDASYPDDVVATTTKRTGADGVAEISWRIETPIGVIERRRRWEEASYSWSVSHWGVETEQDLRVLGYALGGLQYRPRFERYARWTEALGDIGFAYMPIGYSAMGYLLSYWMGIERTIFAAVDMPDVLHEVVDQINHGLLRCVDMVCASPAEVIVMGDNFSSDIQPPRFFAEWSAPHYREVFRRVTAAGKSSSVHVDGLLGGLLRALGEAGADCIDAVTPAPMFDLTPEQCRDEAGPDLILSGGVPPSLWIAEATDDEFRRSVLDWLELRRRSPRLIAAAGDQVPPGALEHRIPMMRELVDQHGRY